MAAPTLESQTGSTFNDAGTTETTGTLTWSAGARVVVVGLTADNTQTLGTPTATGLTFSAVSGFPTNTASTCKGYVWEATAGSSGSGAISSTGGGGAPNVRGIFAWSFTGSDGIGNTASSTTGTGTTVDLTRSGANSAVAWGGADWGATNDVVVSPTPGGGTERVAVNDAGDYTAFVFDWADQGAAGTTSYGITGFAAGNTFTKLAVEILGSGPPPPIAIMYAHKPMTPTRG